MPDPTPDDWRRAHQAQVRDLKAAWEKAGMNPREAERKANSVQESITNEARDTYK